jgi:dTDP-4-dehydrorhamnose reductase
MAAILITGAKGQLGSELRAREETIIRTFQEKAPSMNGGTQIFFTDIDDLDICDPIAVKEYISRNEITHVINCAAYTAVEKAEEDVAKALKINGYAPGYLAAAVKSVNALLIHISTDYVFDGKGSLPYREEDNTSPSTVYGRSKLEGEKAVIASSCRHAIIRASWLYSSFGSNFVKTIIRKALSENSINVVYDQISTPTYAGDLAEAIIEIAASACTGAQKNLVNERSWDEDIYHYSNEGVCSWYDFAVEIIKLAGWHWPEQKERFVNCKVLPVTSDKYPAAAKRPSFSLLNKQKIKERFFLEIPHWSVSLEKCIKLLYTGDFFESRL